MGMMQPATAEPTHPASAWLHSGRLYASNRLNEACKAARMLTSTAKPALSYAMELMEARHGTGSMHADGMRPTINARGSIVVAASAYVACRMSACDKPEKAHKPEAAAQKQGKHACCLSG